MNISKSIFKNTIALLIARVVNLGSSIILLFYLSRMLQAEGLGSYSTAMAFFSIGVLACNLGLSNFIPRELAKDLGQTNRYFLHASILVLISATVVTTLFILFTPLLGYSTQTVISIVVLSLALAPSTLRLVTGSIFISHLRGEFVTMVTLLWTLVRVVVSLYLLYRGDGVIALIATYTLTTYLALFNSLYFYVRYIERPRWDFDLSFFKGMILDLKSFVLLAIGGSLFNQSETVILSWVRNETEVGFYSAAYRLITMWYLIPSSFMEVVFPVLTKAHQHSAHRSEAIQQKALKYLLAIGLPLAVGSFAIAEQTITAFYGPGFKESILVFRIMAWHTILAFANNVFWRILLARGEQNRAVLVQAVSGIIRVILSFVLGSQFGAEGAAWALIGGYTVYTGMHVYYVNRGGTQLPFLKLGGRFALAAAVMGAITLYLSSFLSFLLLIPLAAFIYLAMVILLRAFSEEDMAILYQLLPWQPKAKSAKAAPKGVD